MGYDSTFRGEFKLNKSLTVKDYKFLKNFSETRRMKRNLPEEYGVEGEFYVEGKGYGGQDRNDPSIINFNSPPSSTSR
jgi:intein/homing endonuclease